MGQARLKEALLAVATDDGLDGLLVTGEKGTAKSTLVRGLADLLPDQRAIADCPYACPPDDRSRQCESCRERASYPVETRSVPLVTLPLGASRDRVVGTLSVSDALAGEASFDPGLLARANRGLLYVDEVNLLDDHLVDVLLDAAASGENRVERDGVSVAHPAAFTLVGTMNPEEGDLRPQLRDRFALSVEVEGERDVEDRVAIIDSDLGGTAPTNDDTDVHRERLRSARDLIDEVSLTDDQKREIAALCLDAGVDGHRADIATARTARALAALDGRPTVSDGDIRRAAEYALAHRMRSTPFEDAPDAEDVIDERFGDEESEADESDGGEGDSDEADDGDTDESAGEAESGTDPSGSDDGGDADAAPDSDPGGDDPSDEDVGGEENGMEPSTAGDATGTAPESGSAEEAGSGSEADAAERNENEEAEPLVPGQPRQPVDAAAPEIDPPDAESGTGSGRASASPSAGNRGVRVRTESADPDGSIDAAASARAAATRGSDRIEERDLRQSVRSGTGDALVVFAVDASASMRPAMAATKGVTLELLEGAYTERDSVAVVAFAGDGAEVVLPPTDSVSLAARHLKELPTGDRTPLPAGLRTTASVIDRADPETAVAVVVSDGRANAASNPTADTRSAAEALAATDAGVVCVDAGDERGLLADVVEATDGTLVSLDALTPERVETAIARARE